MKIKQNLLLRKSLQLKSTISKNHFFPLFPLHFINAVHKQLEIRYGISAFYTKHTIRIIFNSYTNVAETLINNVVILLTEICQFCFVASNSGCTRCFNNLNCYKPQLKLISKLFRFRIERGVVEIFN